MSPTEATESAVQAPSTGKARTAARLAAKAAVLAEFYRNVPVYVNTRAEFRRADKANAKNVRKMEVLQKKKRR